MYIYIYICIHVIIIISIIFIMISSNSGSSSSSSSSLVRLVLFSLSSRQLHLVKLAQEAVVDPFDGVHLPLLLLSLLVCITISSSSSSSSIIMTIISDIISMTIIIAIIVSVLCIVIMIMVTISSAIMDPLDGVHLCPISLLTLSLLTLLDSSFPEIPFELRWCLRKHTMDADDAWENILWIKIIPSEIPFESNGWAWEIHPFELRWCLSQTLWNPQC